MRLCVGFVCVAFKEICVCVYVFVCFVCDCVFVWGVYLVCVFVCLCGV